MSENVALLIFPQVGLVEKEWLETLATINADEVTFTDYVDKGRELASSLKKEVSKNKLEITSCSHSV